MRVKATHKTIDGKLPRSINIEESVTCTAQDHPGRWSDNVQRIAGRQQRSGFHRRRNVRRAPALRVRRGQRRSRHPGPPRSTNQRQPMARGQQHYSDI